MNGTGDEGPVDEGSATQVERVARTSYGRLLALLAAPTGDIPLAEDALSDAFVQALTAWPASGVPANPEGWLLTVARNRQRDAFKSSFRRTSAPTTRLRLKPQPWKHCRYGLVEPRSNQSQYDCN